MTVISILVVEDDKNVAHLLEATLSRSGYQVYVANDGPSAHSLIGLKLAKKYDVNHVALFL